MLKNSIDDATFTTLSPVLQGEYKKTGDNYTLQHDEDVGALKRAKDREKERADGLKADIATITTERDALTAAAKQTGTPAEIAARVRAEAEEGFKPERERLTRLESSVKSALLEGTARTLATEIGGAKNAIALLPHIERRIDVKLDGDKPSVFVKDAAGKESKLTLAELATEIRGDKHLSSLVVVSAATGGAGRNTGTVKTSASGAGDVNKPLAAMTPRELREAIDARKATV